MISVDELYFCTLDWKYWEEVRKKGTSSENVRRVLVVVDVVFFYDEEERRRAQGMTLKVSKIGHDFHCDCSLNIE